MSITVEQLAQVNPYVALCLKIGEARSKNDEISPNQRVRAKILALAWFIFKEQALIWALVLEPKKFGKKALIAASIGAAVGAAHELVKPSERSALKDWELWLEREVALKSAYFNFRRFLEGNFTLCQTFVTLLPIEEMSYPNALRIAWLSQHIGKQIIYMGRSR